MGSERAKAILRATSAGAGLPEADWERIERSVASDALAWKELGRPSDITGLACEQNILRHLPTAVTVRVEGDHPADLVRVVAAGLCAGAEVRVSTDHPVPSDLAGAFGAADVRCAHEGETAWRASLAAAPQRVRLVGGSRERFAADSDGRPEHTLFDGPVLEAGRIELLTFVREQALSVTAHRFGMPVRR